VSSEPCPRCGSRAVATGKCLEWWHLGRATRFEPDGLRRFQPFRLRRSGVPLQGGFAVCLTCGLVWSSVAPDELRALLEQYGSEAAKDHLPPADSSGPT
jgi:hypothetical protein